MTYVATPNTVQNPLNTSQQTVFVTQGITDQIVRQNFDSLNKFLAKRLSGKEIEKANLVIGPAWNQSSIIGNSTAVQKLGPLQAQITTRGNPVRIKLAPFFNGPGVAQFGIISVATLLKATVGWMRDGDTVVSQLVSTVAALDGGTSTIQMFFQLPAFEFDDVVPSGTYTYQFFFQLFDTNQTLNISNVNVVAYELR
jgi:hypothetical protein